MEGSLKVRCAVGRETVEGWWKLLFTGGDSVEKISVHPDVENRVLRHRGRFREAVYRLKRTGSVYK